MIKRVIRRWKSSKLFRISVWLFLFLFLTSFALQNFFGESSNNAGTSVIGNQTDMITIPPNTTTFYNTMLTKEVNSFAFASSYEIEYYLFDVSINTNINTSAMRLLSFDYGLSDQYTILIEESMNLTISFVSTINENIDLLFEVREYSPSDMQNIQLWSLGSSVKTLSYFVIVIYLIFGVVYPWYQNKVKTFQSTSKDQSSKKKFCTKCGSDVTNRKFCTKCGKPGKGSDSV